MASYERRTAAGIQEALRKAEAVLTSRLPIEKVREDRHSITLRGGDGAVTISVHPHGLENMVQASTDQLRTSRLDLDVQYYMTLLPYEPEDVGGKVY